MHPMHIKPYLGEEIDRGQSRFAVINRDALNCGFTVLFISSANAFFRAEKTFLTELGDFVPQTVQQ